MPWRIRRRQPVIRGAELDAFSNAYLERQLRGFQEGWRDTTDPYTQSMSAAVGALDAGVVAEALLAIDQLPDSREISVAKAAAGDTDRGADLYTAYCGACHGTNAGGNDALGAPSLLGLDADYLARQYRHFSEGRRGFHADDRYGKQMNRLSRSLKAHPSSMMSVLMWHSCLSKFSLSPESESPRALHFFLWLPQSLTADEHRHSFELATAVPRRFQTYRGASLRAQ